MVTGPPAPEKKEYWTDDIHLAVFMKLKGVPLVDIRGLEGTRDRNYCRFVFGVTRDEGRKWWQQFQNKGPDRVGDIAEALKEYDTLRGQRHKQQ